jgi:hypothetical protein
MKQNKFEQFDAIKFCVKLEEGAIDNYEKIQKAFDNDYVSRVQVLWKMNHGLDNPPL